MSLVLLKVSLSQGSFSLSLLIVGVRPWVSAMHLETIFIVTTAIKRKMNLNRSHSLESWDKR